jgi:hypothetical protein
VIKAGLRRGRRIGGRQSLTEKRDRAVPDRWSLNLELDTREEAIRGGVGLGCWPWRERARAGGGCQDLFRARRPSHSCSVANEI